VESTTSFPPTFRALSLSRAPYNKSHTFSTGYAQGSAREALTEGNVPRSAQRVQRGLEPDKGSFLIFVVQINLFLCSHAYQYKPGAETCPAVCEADLRRSHSGVSGKWR
jgi:hypothetical protein